MIIYYAYGVILVKINELAFYKKKVQLDNLSVRDIFLFKGSVFMKMTSFSFPTMLDLKNNQLVSWNTGHVVVNPLKVQIFLDK